MKPKKFFNLFSISAIAVTVAIFFAGYVIKFYFSAAGPGIPLKADHQAFGVIGDFFGGTLNPIFSLLGLFVLLATLRQNQIELELSRKELQKSTESLTEQAKTQKHQRFDATFFSLLEQHNKLLESINNGRINYSWEGTPSTSSSPTASAISTINHLITSENKSLAEIKTEIIKSYPQLNQYFRVLYQLLKFVCTQNPELPDYHNRNFISILDNTTCTEAEKLYSNIIRSFLSSNLYYLLAVNCHTTNAEDQFHRYKRMIERYNFFEHMPFTANHKIPAPLLNEILNHYNLSAFGNRSDLPTRHGILEKSKSTETEQVLKI